MAGKIEFNTIYDFPIDQVWQALTQKEALSEWLMPCDFEPIVGHKFQFKTKPYPGFDGITHCEVLELKEKELLAFSWSGGSLKNSVVRFRLSPLNNKTRLDFEHSGFEGFLNNLIVKRILASGWKKKILKQLLPQYLSK
jgi:uncharacterized protein YndB with AHSA1/START domain